MIEIRGNTTVQDEGPYLRLCEEVDNWFMMSTPWPVTLVVIAYLCFVLKIGPDFMSNRQPFDIKYVMLVYNFCQTMYNGFLFSLMFTVPGSITYTWNHSCHPMDHHLNPYLRILKTSSWHFFISKMMDLLDTVFLVLRKKNSHITFLHVYHHTTMIITGWSYLKYIKGEQGALLGWINCWVHTVMYFYYFLSALGPSMRPHLWWKKYLTRLQIVQFVVIILFLLGWLIGECELPHSFSYFMIFQIAIFLALFTNFYIKSYTTKENVNYCQQQRQQQRENYDRQNLLRAFGCAKEN